MQRKNRTDIHCRSVLLSEKDKMLILLKAGYLKNKNKLKNLLLSTVFEPEL